MTIREGKAKLKRDPDFIGAEKALLRAAKNARDAARRSGGYVVVYRNGRIVKERLAGKSEKGVTGRKKTR